MKEIGIWRICDRVRVNGATAGGKRRDESRRCSQEWLRHVLYHRVLIIWDGGWWFGQAGLLAGRIFSGPGAIGAKRGERAGGGEPARRRVAGDRQLLPASAVGAGEERVLPGYHF